MKQMCGAGPAVLSVLAMIASATCLGADVIGESDAGVKTLVWNGADGARWDSTTETNWLDGETPTVWEDGANAVFTTDRKVTLGGAVNVADITTAGSLTVSGIVVSAFNEDQGFVPRDSSALVFPGLTLSQLSAVSAEMAGRSIGGGEVGTEKPGTAFHLVVDGKTASAQFQGFNGRSLLCVKTVFTEMPDGVHLQAISACYKPNGTAPLGCDIDSVDPNDWSVSTARNEVGYGIINLKATSARIVVGGTTSLGGDLSLWGTSVDVTSPVPHTWTNAVSCTGGGRLTVKGLLSPSDREFGNLTVSSAAPWLTETAADTVLTNMVLANMEPVSAVMRGSYIGYNGSASIHHVKFNGETMTFQVQHPSPYSDQYWIKGALVELKQSGANVTARAVKTYLYTFPSEEGFSTGLDLEAIGSAANPGKYSVAQYGVKSLTLRTTEVPSLTLGGANSSLYNVVVDNAELVIAAAAAQPSDIVAHNNSLVVYGKQMGYGSNNQAGQGRSRRFDSGSSFLVQRGLVTEAKGYFVFDAASYYNQQVSSDGTDGNNYICDLVLKNGSKVEGNPLRCGYYGASAEINYNSSGEKANVINTGIDMLKTGEGRTSLILTTDADLEVTGKIWDHLSYTGADIFKRGDAKLILSGANTFAGRLTVEEGTLLLAGNAALPPSAPLTLAAGTTVVCGTTSNSTGALTLSGDATIELGDGAIAFADSSAETWADDATLSIAGTGKLSARKVRFGTGASALLPAQAKKILYNGERVALDENGYLCPQPGLVILFR